MTSDKGAPMEHLDEQVAQVRDSILLDGEEVTAQEMGDHGQAIVLTKSRIIIIKVGLTATGTFNGQKSAIYNLDQVKSINLRKGPMGAVIQVCSDVEQPSEPGCSPMNIVVFGGSQKVKRCEAIAALIEVAIGKPVEKFVPKPQQQPVSDMVEKESKLEELEVDQPLQMANDDQVIASDEPVSNQENSTEVSKPYHPSVDEPQNDSISQVAAVDDVTTHINPKEDPPERKGKREARSLAEEMFEGMEPWQPPAEEAQPQAAAPDPEPIAQVETVETPVPEPVKEVDYVFGPPVPVITDYDKISAASVRPVEEHSAQVTEPVDLISEPVIDQHDLSSEYGLNPYLPRPRKKKAQMASGVPVLLGVMMVMLMVGMAVVAPMRNAERSSVTTQIDMSSLSHNAKGLQKQLKAVQNYRVEVERILCNAATASIESSLRSNSRQAAAYAAGQCNADAAWRRISALKTPDGLAAAHEDLVSGMFIRKAAVMNTAAGSINTQEALSRLSDADGLVQKGLSEISRMEKDLANQVSSMRPVEK